MRELISLSNLLLEENELTKEQSERIAQEWIQDIVDDFGRSGSSDISGLGTFHQRKAGAIFTPDDGLALANLLPPIPGFSKPLETTPEPVATIPAEPEAADSEPDVEPKTAPAAVVADPEVREAVVSEVEAAGEEHAEAEVEAADESEAEAPVETDKEKETETEAEAEADTIAETKKALRSRTPNRRPQSNPRAALMIGSFIGLVVISTLIYVFAFQSTNSDIVPDQEVISATATPATPAEGVDETPSSLDAGSENDNANDDPSEQVQVALDPPVTVASVDDTPGNTFTRDTNGYTLMVGSHLTRAQARSSINSYSSLGLPLGVLEYQTDEVTRYRMGVGIFPTVNSAVEALESMQGQLPDGAWVFRIR